MCGIIVFWFYLELMCLWIFLFGVDMDGCGIYVCLEWLERRIGVFGFVEEVECVECLVIV